MYWFQEDETIKKFVLTTDIILKSSLQRKSVVWYYERFETHCFIIPSQNCCACVFMYAFQPCELDLNKTLACMFIKLRTLYKQV